jgi:hypothetical protein
MSSLKSDETRNKASDIGAKSVPAGLTLALALPQRMAEVNFEAASELMIFMSRRMEAQSELFRGLGHCRDFSGLAEMQREFWKQASADYSKEMSQLADIARANVAKVTGFVAEGAAPTHAA